MKSFTDYEKEVAAIESSLTLKANYTAELKALADIETDLPIFQYHLVPQWKMDDLNAHINHIRNWILAEQDGATK